MRPPSATATKYLARRRRIESASPHAARPFRCGQLTLKSARFTHAPLKIVKTAGYVFSIPCAPAHSRHDKRPSPPGCCAERRLGDTCDDLRFWTTSVVAGRFGNAGEPHKQPTLSSIDTTRSPCGVRSRLNGRSYGDHGERRPILKSVSCAAVKSSRSRLSRTMASSGVWKSGSDGVRVPQGSIGPRSLSPVRII